MDIDAGTHASKEPQLEQRILGVGTGLADALAALIAAVPEQPRGPVELGRALSIDKVLASRILKAARNRDPLAALHQAPGPEPLRRVLRSAARKRVPAEVVARAEVAVEAFERLIRQEAGDRSALHAMITAWLPEARREFELRRKQSAYRAMSELKGASTEISLSTGFLYPSPGSLKLDVVWLFGVFGLQRLRPGVPVKFTSRRIAQESNPRRPVTLDGELVEDLRGLRLDAFSSQPAIELDVLESGDVVRYLLPDNGFGPKVVNDLVYAEVNREEMSRSVPAGSGRKGYLYADVSVPTRRLILDVLLYEGVYPGSEPSLALYDTISDGVADVNDPSRDFDRFDLLESIQPLGRGIGRFRSAKVPRYSELLSTVCSRLGWDGEGFRGYRCEIEYPIYGSQVTMIFEPPEDPVV